MSPRRRARTRYRENALLTGINSPMSHNARKKQTGSLTSLILSAFVHCVPMHDWLRAESVWPHRAEWLKARVSSSQMRTN